MCVCDVQTEQSLTVGINVYIPCFKIDMFVIDAKH